MQYPPRTCLNNPAHGRTLSHATSCDGEKLQLHSHLTSSIDLPNFSVSNFFSSSVSSDAISANVCLSSFNLSATRCSFANGSDLSCFEGVQSLQSLQSAR